MGTPSTHPTKPARMWCGDGVGYITIQIPLDATLCPECEGLGQNWHANCRDGFEYGGWSHCARCDGNGQLTIKTEENEQ